MTDKVVKYSFPLRYQGNVFFLIIFLIFWAPIGILLGIKNANFIADQKHFYLHYHGSWTWLFFWSIFFFPISFLLLLLKGIDIVEA